jgi:2-oxoisovalerate dehydrogenase E1 component
MTIEYFKSLAISAPNLNGADIPQELLEEALRIRAVEEKFLELFNTGQMNGTVHTCVGQEFSAVAVAGQLENDDWVTSNHRCHGHFISRTKNWQGLIDELRGLDSGVCRGIGSSQHLYSKGFLSNGLQGAFVPVAAGIALHFKRLKQRNIAVSYIGEGTLGEGVVYEAMNLAALFELPHLIVCENNLYSQSTPQAAGIAGDILARPAAFGIKVFEGNTWHLSELLQVARDAIDYVRNNCAPAFLLIRTYRLNAHSKGDDDREKAEISFFNEADPLNRLLNEPLWAKVNERIEKEIDDHVLATQINTMPMPDYLRDELPRSVSARLMPVENPRVRMVQALNKAYKKTIEENAVHIGEDIHDPYGGAFKVTKGLMDAHPESVYTTSISEAGLVGIATGLALMGTPAWAEIMFGDFMTNVFDQVVNNLAKIHHMYAFQASVPVRIRTPMGGKRGYGPTHSQSLEKFFVGIDNVATVYLTSLIDPCLTIIELSKFDGPVLVMENKVDYGRYLWSCPKEFSLTREARPAASLLIKPNLAAATVSIVSYGETAREIADGLEKFFIETDLVPELVVLQLLHPLDIRLIERSVRRTGQLIIVEDGSTDYGIGGEIVARLIEQGVALKKIVRIGAEAVPIPSAAALELQVLPTMQRILSKIRNTRVHEVSV